MFVFLMKLPFLKKIIPKIIILLLKLKKKQKGFFQIQDFWLFLDFNEPVDREIIIFKKYETTEVKVLSCYFEKFKITNFIDVGANCGYYTFYFAKKFPSINIFSFEPNNDAFEKLKKSYHKNYGNIKIFNFGLSNTNSILKMRSLKKNNHIQSGGATINHKKVLLNSEVIYDASFKIGDEVLDIKNNTIALKIDIEGHELNALEGLKNILLKNKIILQIEIFNENYYQVDNFLKKLNYNLIFQIKKNNNYYYTNIK